MSPLFRLLLQREKARFRSLPAREAARLRLWRHRSLFLKPTTPGGLPLFLFRLVLGFVFALAMALPLFVCVLVQFVFRPGRAIREFRLIARLSMADWLETLGLWRARLSAWRFVRDELAAELARRSKPSEEFARFDEALQIAWAAKKGAGLAPRVRPAAPTKKSRRI